MERGIVLRVLQNEIQIQSLSSTCHKSFLPPTRSGMMCLCKIHAKKGIFWPHLLNPIADIPVCIICKHWKVLLVSLCKDTLQCVSQIQTNFPHCLLVQRLSQFKVLGPSVRTNFKANFSCKLHISQQPDNVLVSEVISF